MVSHAGYDRDTQVLFLTYHSGPTTVAYHTVPEELFTQLTQSPYPDVCIRFRVQAQHVFRRVEPSFEPLDYTFIK